MLTVQKSRVCYSFDYRFVLTWSRCVIYPSVCRERDRNTDVRDTESERRHEAISPQSSGEFVGLDHRVRLNSVRGSGRSVQKSGLRLIWPVGPAAAEGARSIMWGGGATPTWVGPRHRKQVGKCQSCFFSTWHQKRAWHSLVCGHRWPLLSQKSSHHEINRLQIKPLFPGLCFQLVHGERWAHVGMNGVHAHGWLVEWIHRI